MASLRMDTISESEGVQAIASFCMDDLSCAPVSQKSQAWLTLGRYENSYIRKNRLYCILAQVARARNCMGWLKKTVLNQLELLFPELRTFHFPPNKRTGGAV
jgi:hypothetical protein